MPPLRTPQLVQEHPRGFTVGVSWLCYRAIERPGIAAWPPSDLAARVCDSDVGITVRAARRGSQYQSPRASRATQHRASSPVAASLTP